MTAPPAGVFDASAGDLSASCPKYVANGVGVRRARMDPDRAILDWPDCVTELFHDPLAPFAAVLPRGLTQPQFVRLENPVRRHEPGLRGQDEPPHAGLFGMRDLQPRRAPPTRASMVSSA